MDFALKCTACGLEFEGQEPIWRCTCGGLLDLAREYRFDRNDLHPFTHSMWRYNKAIPVTYEERISFDEGLTPLVPVILNDRQVLIKQDHLFQTGSYKDRGAAVLVSHAKSIGIKRVVEDSSGNAGCAIAAYCARARIACEIYVPASTSTAKLAQIERYGAILRMIPGSREDTAHAVLDAAQHSYYASHSWNPFFFEGTKTFAYEVCEQLGWRAPDVLILPAGNGTLLLGAFRGFCELKNAGLIYDLPKIIGVQTAACAPLAEAYARGLNVIPIIAKKDTLAEGIAIAQPVRGVQILQAVRVTNGDFVTVSEDDIKQCLLEICSRGFYIEPTSAATIAGIKKALPGIAESSIIVSVFTGHGLKATDKMIMLGQPHASSEL